MGQNLKDWHFDQIDSRTVHFGFLNLGTRLINGVTRSYFDGRPSIFLSDADLAAEIAEAERLAQEEVERLAAEKHDEEMRAEGANAKFERVLSALDSQFPGFRKQVNDLAKEKRITRAAALKEIQKLQALVIDADEALEDLAELGYKGHK